jgi:hypothetical protein
MRWVSTVCIRQVRAIGDSAVIDFGFSATALSGEGAKSGSFAVAGTQPRSAHRVLAHVSHDD